MEIEFELTEKDLIQFHVYHIKNTKIARRSMMINRIIGPLFLIVFGFILASAQGSVSGGLIAIILILSVCWVFLYPKYFYYLVARNTKKGLEDQQTKGMIGHHRLVLNNEGLFDSTATGTTSASWDTISLKEDQDHLFIYYGPTNAYIVPKRSIDRLEELRQYIQSHIKK